MARQDFTLQVLMHVYLGNAYHSMGAYGRAMEVLSRNVVALQGELAHERFGVWAIPAVVSRTWLVWCLAELGAFAEGIARGEEGVQIAEAVNHPVSLIYAYSSIGRLYLHKGDLPQAIAVLERALELCQIWNVPLRFPLIAAALGMAYALSGQISKTLPLLERAVTAEAAMGIRRDHALLVAWLGEGYLYAGQDEEARKAALQAFALSQDHKERGHEAWALRLLGEIAAHHDPPEPDQAEASYRQALALAEELGMRPLLAHGHLGLGTLYATIGQREQSRTELVAAIELYRAMEMTLWLPQAEATLAEVKER